MDRQDYIHLQKSIEEWYETTNENIVAVGFAKKITNNITTDDLSIQFSVAEKKNLSDLDESEILPEHININGLLYKTDVIQQPLRFFAGSCYSWDPPDASIIPHRSLQQPILGGLSIGPNNETSAGTFGAVCWDSLDQTLIGLTNNHVIIQNGFLNASRLHYNINSDISNNKYISSNMSDIVQPSLIELANTQKIGPVKRYLPFSHNSMNYVDAAIISLSSNVVDSQISYKQLNNTLLTYAPSFASTSEINSLLNSPKPKIYKSGRTTGFIGGDICPIEILALMQTLTVGGYSPYNAAVTFSDVIVYKFTQNNSSGRPMGGVSVPGDSGSVILAEFNGIQKIIGLNFAAGSFQNGDPQWNGGILCRIDRVAELLNISSWNGNDMRFSDPNSWIYYEDNNNTENYNIIKDEKKYWQIGTI